MTYLFILFLVGSGKADGSELIWTPVEEIAPKIRFVRFTKKEEVHYKFQDGGLFLDFTHSEDQLEKHRPHLLELLVESFDKNNEWIEVSSLYDDNI